MMANNKRKGRTRIKLDARKIALAKQLILREATTTVIANELNISRTFAWRLRKSLVNGVSLHERVIDPPEEDDDNNDYGNDAIGGGVEAEHETEPAEDIQRPENLLNHHPFTEHIKSENADTDEEVEGEHHNDQEDMDDHMNEQQHQLEHHHLQMLKDQRKLEQTQTLRQQTVAAAAVGTSVIQRTTKANEQDLAQRQQQQLHLQQQQAIEQKFHNTISVVQQQRLMELNPNKEYATTHRERKASLAAPSGIHDDATDDDDDDGDGSESREDSENHYLQQQQQQEQEQHETDMNKCGVNSQLQTQQKYLKMKLNSLNNIPDSLGGGGGSNNNNSISIISQLSPAVAAAM